MSEESALEDSAPAKIVVRGVGRKYKAFNALSDLNIELGPGVSAVLGRNGAGKSTLVRALVGADRRYSGEISMELQGERLSASEAMKVTGWLPQVFGFPKHMTAADFVAYAAWLKQAPADRDTILTALEMGDVTSVSEQHMDTLSGGTLRRVGFAASVVHRPKFLVLDEPTTGLEFNVLSSTNASGPRTVMSLRSSRLTFSKTSPSLPTRSM